MNTDKIWIRDVAEICAAKGIRHAVIAPGSRSAPLVIAFSRQPEINCHSIIDERAAGFFALGIAQQTKQPVALICTSGSAALNFAPAVGEAFYQRVPLLVLTADRPDELIDQRDGQTIRQQNLYEKYILKSFHLPVVAEAEDDRWYSSRIISEAINISLAPVPGPVHVNVPLREPLYKQHFFEKYLRPKTIEWVNVKSQVVDEEKIKLRKEWYSYKKKMIIAGFASFDESVCAGVKRISADTVVLAESTSNIGCEELIPCIDPVLEALPQNDKASFGPDLVVTIGGEIVSKKIKAFLRNQRSLEHWHVDAGGDHVDTFKCLTKVFPMSAADFFEIIENAASNDFTFQEKWWKAYEDAKKLREKTLASAPFSDFTIFNEILKNLPKNCNLHLANSTPVRYANLFEIDPEISVNCNRGTSGIDGTISTAAGAAAVNGKLTVVITGDIGFFYDSNALWNKNLPPNLRIIIINNSGGNIFRIIPGPSSLAELEEFFETKQDLSAKNIAAAFSVDYFSCEDQKGLKQLSDFFQKTPRAALLEIKTSNEVSAKVLREYMKM